MPTIDSEKDLRKQLLALLKGDQAHATFDQAIKDLPAKFHGVVPERLPYSAWQLLEHLRITQRDILDFSTNQDGHYKELGWPDDYWPESKTPSSSRDWDESIRHYKADLAAVEKLVQSEDLHTSFSWGDGHNLLREVLLIADHTAYHLGELIVLRRILGEWKK